MTSAPSVAEIGPARSPSNGAVAAMLDDVGELLELQGANRFRVQAYRNAADTVRLHPAPMSALLDSRGIAGLDELPRIGPGIARAIAEILATGRLQLLERLRGEHDPVASLASVPGVGRVLAQRLHDEFDIETLEALELAAHDGRLARIPGFGPKRVRSVREALAGRFGRAPREVPQTGTPPAVGELLDVDREYRTKAAAGMIPRIAPRRFNPTGEAWLPVLHTRRGGRHYTALFSNTALAHRLRRSRDWVVIYLDGPERQYQCTVVTERQGPLAGRRVVRGRETECMAHHRPNARTRTGYRTRVAGVHARHQHVGT